MVGARALLVGLVGLGLLTPPQAWAGEAEPPTEAAEVAAPEAKPGQTQFRADFKTGYALTEGAGMTDHITMELTIGPQFGRAVPGGRIGVAPIFAGTFTIAEGGSTSLRLQAGLELAIGVAKDVELVPIITGGFLKAFEDDLRQGPTARASLAFRVLGKQGFYLCFEPISLVMLPPPPGGFTRYTSHVALDMGVVKVGGRGP